VRIARFGYALSLSAAALLAACGGSEPLISASGAIPPTTAARTRADARYEVLYSFGTHDDDGASPYAGLIDVKGKLYGTTVNGGANCIPSGGCGTIFSVELSGKETVLYSFAGYPYDGASPYAGLLDVKGTLYGTTYYGGSYAGGSACYYNAGCGAVFSVTPSGAETVLHRFGGSGDGEEPYAGLINITATLYGTTVYGGANDEGTVFKITPSGTETVLHSFPTGSRDGDQPNAGLINVKGTLYGTTDYGGTNGRGTVFRITPSGTETVLHSFTGCDCEARANFRERSSRGRISDGAYPEAQLLDVNGTLYGTTGGGGSTGQGTVFSITTAGKERVLYSFVGNPDGAYPDAQLLDVNGTLYGTTEGGGTGGSGGTGTVFSITTAGKERVLYSFVGRPDGANPDAQLLDVNGTLYGTTSSGGAHNDGIVFSLKRLNL
jgi:uncharacterized repeat protein (TIGR03803 family)